MLLKLYQKFYDDIKHAIRHVIKNEIKFRKVSFRQFILFALKFISGMFALK